MTGETALHFAVGLRHGEAAEVLLKRCPTLVNEADKVCASLRELTAFRTGTTYYGRLKSAINNRQYIVYAVDQGEATARRLHWTILASYKRCWWLSN